MKKGKRTIKSRAPRPHLSADELLAIRSATERPAWNVEVRVIHHLALPCPECWGVARHLPPVTNGEAEQGHPVSRALCRLGMPEDQLCGLTEDHRRALAEASHRPVAFCQLLLEESWLAARESPEPPAEYLYGAFGPIGGNGACLLALREAHDLQAHFYDFLSAAYRDAWDTRRADNAAALAEAHRPRGSGGEEPAGQANGPGTSKTVNRPRPSKTAKPKKRRST